MLTPARLKAMVSFAPPGECKTKSPSSSYSYATKWEARKPAALNAAGVTVCELFPLRTTLTPAI